jgi:hypothetical protein
MNRIARTLVAGLSLVAVAPGAVAVAQHGDGDHVRASAQKQGSDSALVKAVSAVDRSTKWKLTNKIKLKFPTFHTEGIAFAGDRVFLSAVQILTPTIPYPTPIDGYDRSAGTGIGHLFVMDRRGNLIKDIVLGEGRMYHPGGIDFDGKNVWVPVAEYRPDSRSIIYRVDAKTLKVHKQFEADDHFGGIVLDKTTGHLVGNTWASRRFAEWDVKGSGKELSTWKNRSQFIDYQDCQYVSKAKMICGGVANLPQTSTAGGALATYELGGVALIDLRSHRVLNELPFQQWSSAGHVATRNPVKLAVDGDTLTMWAAPDNGEERKGTEILTYEATVPK